MHLGNGQCSEDRKKGDGYDGAVLKGKMQKRFSRSVREWRELLWAGTWWPFGQWAGSRSTLLT